MAICMCVTTVTFNWVCAVPVPVSISTEYTVIVYKCIQALQSLNYVLYVNIQESRNLISHFHVLDRFRICV